MEHRTLKLIRECAEEAGCDIIAIDDARKHIAVTVGKDGQTRRVTVSVSASDQRAAKNIVKDMRNVFTRTHHH